MRSLRSQLALSHTLPILLLVAILSLFLLRTLEGFYSRSLLSQLDYQARLLHGWLERDRGLAATEDHAEAFLTQLSALTAARVVIFSPDAVILASTEQEDAERVGSRYTDPGVAQALRGEVARGIGPGITSEVAYVVMPLPSDGASFGALRLSYDVADFRAQFERLRWLVLFGAAITVIVGLALGAGLSATITRPLSALFRSVGSVSAGEYGSHVPTNGPTEIAALAESFNQMNERLEQAERARNQQLSVVIHELARPVTGIRAALETLQDGADQDAEFRDLLLEGSVEELGRLERLIGTLRGLRNRRLEPLRIAGRETDLNAVIDGCLATFAPRAAQHAVALSTRLPAELRVRGDSDRLIQLLSNLLDNALKFTPRGGAVSVKGSRIEEMVWIEIADTGAGISKTELPHIFQHFYRGEAAVAADHPGMGLGLAICKEIVEAHGGQMWAGNRREGGAAITVGLPAWQ